MVCHIYVCSVSKVKQEQVRKWNWLCQCYGKLVQPDRNKFVRAKSTKFLAPIVIRKCCCRQTIFFYSFFPSQFFAKSKICLNWHHIQRWVRIEIVEMIVVSLRWSVSIHWEEPDANKNEIISRRLISETRFLIRYRRIVGLYLITKWIFVYFHTLSTCRSL